jgi:predicted acyltransferase
MKEDQLQSRLASMDVYRGFVMFLMMAEVLEFCRVASAKPASWFWATLCWHQSHVEWVGCSLHDMIQPSFSFLVGTAMVYSMRRRGEAGSDFVRLFLRVLRRALVLILLGIFLRSMGASQTYFTFEDTLTQIGLGYPFLFLASYLSLRWQAVVFAILLFGYWLAFALHPLPVADFDYAAAGADPGWWHNLQGFAAHWNKNTNLAWAVDRWFLNLFPVEKTFQFNEGGYTTLSFVPTLATMLLGLFAGQWLLSPIEPGLKIKKFILWGSIALAAGLAIHFLGICPIVKRIWTPAWVLWSGGGCLLFLAFFYWLVDIRQVRRPFFWLTVIGMNSIAAYVLAHTVIGFIHSTMQTHFGQGYDSVLPGSAYASLVRGGIQLLVQWLVLFGMWKHRIFIKI